MREMGILGGTFDPVHNGHVALARSAMQALGLDEVRFVPTGKPHFKLDQPVTPAAARVAMLELAIAGQDGFTLDCREVQRDGVTYTLDTLLELGACFPDARLDFIIGADSACTLAHWRGAEQLAGLARFVVVQRPGVSFERVERSVAGSGIAFELCFVPGRLPDVSSTHVRELAARGESLAGLVPPAVETYIRDEGLYAQDAAVRRVEEG